MAIRQFFTFPEGEKLILEFEKLLIEHGINVKRDSNLENKFLSALDVLFKFKNRHLIDPDGDHRNLLRDFSALYDLALKILFIQKHSALNELIPHLKKLNTCDFALNSKSPVTDSDANKIIELYIASLCMQFCDEIELDDPDNSKGNNPDVIANIHDEWWGFACKTIHTHNSRTLYENIVKAVDQIEKSNCKIGIPVINFKNVLPHDIIWPKQGDFTSEVKPLEIMKKSVEDIIKASEKEVGLDAIISDFKGKKSLPGILCIAQSVSLVNHNIYLPSTPTRLNIMSLYRFSETGFDNKVIEIFKKLNHLMQLSNQDKHSQQ